MSDNLECPKCSSTQIFTNKISTGFFNKLIGIKKVSNQCVGCGNTWLEDGNAQLNNEHKNIYNINNIKIDNELSYDGIPKKIYDNKKNIGKVLWDKFDKQGNFVEKQEGELILYKNKLEFNNRWKEYYFFILENGEKYNISLQADYSNKSFDYILYFTAADDDNVKILAVFNVTKIQVDKIMGLIIEHNQQYVYVEKAKIDSKENTKGEAEEIQNQEEELQKNEWEKKRQEYKRQQAEKAKLWEKQENERNELEERKRLLEQQELINKIAEGGKLETYVGLVKWYVVDEEEFKPGYLTLNNYIAEINLLNDSTIMRVTISERDYYTYSKQSEYFKSLVVHTDSQKTIHHFLVNNTVEHRDRDINNQDIIIENHYELMNKAHKLKQNIFKNEVEQNYSQLINNEEINTIVYNYIDKTDKVFLTLTSIVIIERLLILKHRIGKLTLMCNDEEFPNALIFNNVLDNFEDEINLELMNNYYNEKFLKLVKLIKRKNTFSSDEVAIFVTWNLLRVIIIRYYHDLFDKNYGQYVLGVEMASLEECIEQYINIDTIDINSINNASILTYFLMYKGKFEDNNHFLKSNRILISILSDFIEKRELDNFENKLLQNQNRKNITIDDIDLMSGLEFENFISTLFSKMGYSTTVTKGSGDQGIDVIAEKNGQKIGIQAKCYINAVSNKAIQEVVAGLSYYNLDKGMVVTNNYFTESAKDLAGANGIILWDRNMLKERINEMKY